MKGSQKSFLQLSQQYANLKQIFELHEIKLDIIEKEISAVPFGSIKFLLIQTFCYKFNKWCFTLIKLIGEAKTILFGIEIGLLSFVDKAVYVIALVGEVISNYPSDLAVVIDILWAIFEFVEQEVYPFNRVFRIQCASVFFNACP